MFEYFENKQLCVEAGWLYDKDRGDVMSKSNYDRLRNKGIIRVVRRACYETPALVEYESIPDRFRKIIVAKEGDPYQKAPVNHFESFIEADPEAAEFFSNYKLPDGRNLPPETQNEYKINAEILNAVHIIVTNRKAKRRALGGQTKDTWTPLAQVVSQLKNKYKHTLPGNPRRLYDRYRAYRKESYTSLIHKNFCNNHSRKVNEQIESLILSLACMPEKPYNNVVNDLYLQFLGGAIEVANQTTGEIYNPADFKDSDGKPIVLSDSTIWNYLNLPKNKVLIDKLRNDSKYYNDKHRPHHHRQSPVFSLSKISLDDRDLPRKMHDGNRVKAYYAYDVASTAVIGAAYSRNKDTGLFVDCVRDMFQFLERNHLGQPAEVEVEHHLVNQFENDLMRAGMIFPFVRWCNPGNSQEKRAEHFNRAKKYGFEKRYQVGIGRHTSRLEANRPKQTGEWNENGMRIKEKTYTFDELVADDRQTIADYNTALHPNQKLYPGKTRLEVLTENQNPKLQNLNKSLLYRYIGNETKTTIRRNMYLTVQGFKFQLSSPNVIDMLEPGNYNVAAYWMPDNEGNIETVYIYQNGLFVDTCQRIERYNEAKAEQTERDTEAYTNQSKYVSKFDAKVKQGRKAIAKIEIMQPVGDEWESQPANLLPEEPETDETGYEDAGDFYSDNAINSL